MFWDIIGWMVLVLISLALILLGPGYVLWLATRRKCSQGSTSSSQDRPFVDIIVPLKDERLLIEEKLKNLKSLDYPADLISFWLVDGASSDGTTAFLTDFVRENERFHLLEFAISNKTAQLNHALPYCKGSWILVTDADAILPGSILQEMVSLGQQRNNLAVIGSLVEPHHALVLEQWHWRFSNWLRRQESKFGFASFVTAPCYLFRRTLLMQFPEDTISDDIHVALLALSQGHEVVLVPQAVTELRSPATFRQLVFHKWRKSRAYFREIFRFLPQVFHMPLASREVFVWRAAQLILLPILGLLAFGLFVQSFTMIPFLYAGLTISLVAVVKKKSILSLGSWFLLAILWIIVLLVALIGLPFSRQTACFRRIGMTDLVPESSHEAQR